MFSVLLFLSNVMLVTSQEVFHWPEGDAGVQDIFLPMCRNFLPYNQTRLPNRFGHTSQLEVNRHLELIWETMDYGCSTNFRLFMCSLHLPKWDPQTKTTIGPCRETCSRARKQCKGHMRHKLGIPWPNEYRCSDLPSMRSDTNYIRPDLELCRLPDYSYCIVNTAFACQNTQSQIIHLPNWFNQRNFSEIETELSYFQPLIETGCHAKLENFLCAAYMPSCGRSGVMRPLCRAFCEQVVDNCAMEYHIIYNGLTWPSKLNCHRFDAANCSMPWCKDFPRMRGGAKCIQPDLELCHQPNFSYCRPNTVPICQNTSNKIMYLPNLFNQRNISEIEIELSFYQSLIQIGCHENLVDFLCASYTPSCGFDTIMFPPCKAFCEQIIKSCDKKYQQLYNGLKWPGKLNCDMFRTNHCIMA